MRSKLALDGFGIPGMGFGVLGPLKMLFLRVLGGQKMSPERGF